MTTNETSTTTTTTASDLLPHPIDVRYGDVFTGRRYVRRFYVQADADRFVAGLAARGLVRL